MENRGFTYVLSEEDTGTGDDIHKASSATEWWVAFYKDQKVSVAEDLINDGLGGFLAGDRSNNDNFERVPYSFPFRTKNGGTDFVLISVHFQPNSGPSYRARRKQELEAIYNWIDAHDAEEKDFLIVGDMNLYSCEILDTIVLGAFKTLNSDCLNTNTNVNGPEPYDHVLYRPNFTTEIDLDYGFKVIDLVAAMKVPWYEDFTHEYPGDPYDHNPFRARYSDHHPVAFKIISSSDDD